jgi:hypothetical protein
MRAMLAILCVALTASAVAGQASVPAPASLRPVSVFADGCFCPGWWTLDIDDSGRLTVSLASQADGARALTPEERRTFSRLVDALPNAKTKYHFGVAYVDVSAVFDLIVGTGPQKRRYIVTDTLEGDKTHPELQPVLSLLAFLRGLVQDRQALQPPPPNAGKDR